MKTHIIFSFVSITVVLVSGCASSFNPIGESKYDCNRKQDPSSFYCRSFSAVEASTNGALPETRFGTPFRIEDQDARQNIAPPQVGQNAQQSSVVYVTAGTAAGTALPPAAAIGGVPMALPHQARSAPLEGAPVRNGPVIQRVWIKRHVTADDALVESTIVYKETRAPSWAGFKPATPGVSTDSAVAAYPRRAPADKSEKTSASGTSSSAPAEQPRIFQPSSMPARAEEEAAPSPADTGDNSMPK